LFGPIAVASKLQYGWCQVEDENLLLAAAEVNIPFIALCGKVGAVERTDNASKPEKWTPCGHCAAAVMPMLLNVAIADLREKLSGPLLTPDAPGYDVTQPGSAIVTYPGVNCCPQPLLALLSRSTRGAAIKSSVITTFDAPDDAGAASYAVQHGPLRAPRHAAPHPPHSQPPARHNSR
jgi:hypothetical protein